MYLPPKMKGIGDTYVRSEFQLHKDVKQEKQLEQFMKAWTGYLGGLQRQRSKEGKFGAALGDQDLSTKFTPEQKEKLQELRTELKNQFKDE